ncbi:hypothetical protein ABIF68_002533 [Bradyrhizobium japonicum]
MEYESENEQRYRSAKGSSKFYVNSSVRVMLMMGLSLPDVLRFTVNSSSPLLMNALMTRRASAMQSPKSV